MALVALVTIFLVPYYARLLGPLQWGLVAQCLTLQGVLFTLEIVQGPLAIRDVARAARCGTAIVAYRRCLKRYLLIGGMAIGLLQIGWWVLPVVGDLPAATHFLRLHSDNWWILQLALLQFAAQLVNGAAIAYWSGVHEGWRASANQALFLMLKHCAALLALTLCGATAANYMMVMAGVSVIEVVYNATLLVRVPAESARGADFTTEPDPGAAPSPELHANTGLFVAATLLGTIASQLDRIVLVAVLTAAEFGRYYLATVVALSFLGLQMPLARTFLPYIAAGTSPAAALRAMLAVGLVTIVVPAWLIALLSTWFLQVWLHDAALAMALADVLPWMLIGVSLIAVYSPVSSYLLGQARYAEMFVASSCALAAQTLVLVGLLWSGQGIIAGGISWFAGGAVYLLFVLHLLARDRPLRAALRGR